LEKVSTAAGSALWNALLIGGGMMLGDNYERITATVDTFSNLVLVVLVVSTVGAVVWWSRRKARRRSALVD
jgi:membrane protein DedA with SNARE-associated domain